LSVRAYLFILDYIDCVFTILSTYVIYQSLFTNTLVGHAYTEYITLKNKHGVKKNTYTIIL